MSVGHILQINNRFFSAFTPLTAPPQAWEIARVSNNTRKKTVTNRRPKVAGGRRILSVSISQAHYEMIRQRQRELDIPLSTYFRILVELDGSHGLVRRELISRLTNINKPGDKTPQPVQYSNESNSNTVDNRPRRFTTSRTKSRDQKHQSPRV